MSFACVHSNPTFPGQRHRLQPNSAIFNPFNEIMRLAVVIVSASAILSKEDYELVSLEISVAVATFRLFLEHHRSTWVITPEEDSWHGDFITAMTSSYCQRLYQLLRVAETNYQNFDSPTTAARLQPTLLTATFNRLWSDHFIPIFSLPEHTTPTWEEGRPDDSFLFIDYFGDIVSRHPMRPNVPLPHVPKDVILFRSLADGNLLIPSSVSSQAPPEPTQSISDTAVSGKTVRSLLLIVLPLT